jgi:hypothetical protein
VRSGADAEGAPAIVRGEGDDPGPTSTKPPSAALPRVAEYISEDAPSSFPLSADAEFKLLPASVEAPLPGSGSGRPRDGCGAVEEVVATFAGFPFPSMLAVKATPFGSLPARAFPVGAGEARTVPPSFPSPGIALTSGSVMGNDD